MYAHMNEPCTCVEVRGQFAGVGFLLLFDPWDQAHTIRLGSTYFYQRNHLLLLVFLF